MPEGRTDVIDSQDTPSHGVAVVGAPGTGADAAVDPGPAAPDPAAPDPADPGPADGAGPGGGSPDESGPTPGPTGQGSRPRRPGQIVVTVVIVAALVVGTMLRLWFLFNQPLQSDEAIVGLMAHHFLTGHANAFYWGQPYGGVEPWLVTGVFAVAGQSTWTLTLTPVLLSAVAAVLVWRVALRMVGDRRLAALAGAVSWAAPLSTVYQSTVEGGSREATLVFSLAALLFSLRILDGRRSYLDFAALGVTAGLAWWALPESVYLLFPAALVLIGAVATSSVAARAWFWVRHLALVLAGFVVAALPWLWFNVQSGFASLQSAKFAGSAGPENHGFGSRLNIVLQGAIPIQLNLRRLLSGIWLWNGPSQLHTVIMYTVGAVAVAIVVGSVVLCGLRGGRGWAIAGALVAFPFLAAAQPGTWYFVGGRYELYLGSLLAIAVAVAVEELARRLSGRGAHSHRQGAGLARWAMSLIVVGALALTVIDFHLDWNGPFTAYFKVWSNPNQSGIDTAQALEAAGVHYGYADYWIAYKLDFLSHDALALTTIAPDPDRWYQLNGEVNRAKSQAWLFVPSKNLQTAFEEFGFTIYVQGPGLGLPEATFEAKLRALGIPYRVVHAGLVDAVIPARTVSPVEAGMG